MCVVLLTHSNALTTTVTAPRVCRNYLTVGDCFGEVAFFMDIPQMQTVRTITVCRVLVVPRPAYHSIKSAFPVGSRQVLDNLQAHAEKVRTTPSNDCRFARIGQLTHMFPNKCITFYNSITYCPAVATALSCLDDSSLNMYTDFHFSPLICYCIILFEHCLRHLLVLFILDNYRFDSYC